MEKCIARQYGDQYICNECKLVWDCNDSEPPECKTQKEKNNEAAKKFFSAIRKKLSS